ncbi:MAG: lipoate--protein ligase family protein [Pseudomonadota bacterium]
MKPAWRVLDTGLRPAAENLAFNRALLEARQAGESVPTLRFLRFKPSALLGYHQSAEQELNLDFCHEHGITVQRRITGGGAIYMDETVLGWELYLTRRELGLADMAAVARRICEAAARGLRTLGVDAAYRPRNDIEVDGRKISGTGGAFDGDALMYQGTLLIDFDVERMLRALRIPAEKLSDKGIAAARDRVINLAALLGEVPPLETIRARLTEAFAAEFGVAFVPGDLIEAEDARYRQALAEMDHPDWVHLLARPLADMPMLEAAEKFPGGLVRASVAFDAAGRRVKQVWFTGDFFVQPRRLVADLEAHLRDVALDDLEARVGAFFSARSADLLQLDPLSFARVIRSAVAGAMNAEAG